MPGPLDDTLKHLTELSPTDWVVRGGWRPAPAIVVDADIATISGATDKVIRVEDEPNWLLSVDFHAGHDVLAKLPDLLLYNSALYRRHALLVRSLLVLLHRGADSPQLTGLYERGFPGEPPDVTLRYRILRVWQVPAAQWLAGGVGLTPLAPLGDLPPDELLAVVTQVQQRIERDAPPREAVSLLSAMYILMGLRYDQPLVQRLLQEVLTMRESATYQAILEEGRADEARRMLRLVGRDKFGELSAQAEGMIDAITDVNRLEQLIMQVRHATSWYKLLGLPTPRRRSSS